jgi:glycosyltransferase involved in cell wall biosynthesis
VCLAHQQPLFATLFAPVAKARGIPVLLWYAHGGVPLWLRVAHALVDRCISSSPAGFRLPSDKLFVVGQGIDTEVFRPPGTTQHLETHTAVSIGRISPVKGLEEMIDAVSLVRQSGRELRLRIVGGPVIERDHRYLKELRDLARALAVEDLISFEGPVSFRDVPAWYHRGALFLNLSQTRSLDKALLEAMASGCIPISRNESFQAIARDRGYVWLVPEPGAEGLARSILQVVDLPAQARAELLHTLRRTVEEEHDLNRLMERITRHLVELATVGAAMRRRTRTENSSTS